MFNRLQRSKGIHLAGCLRKRTTSVSVHNPAPAASDTSTTATAIIAKPLAFHRCSPIVSHLQKKKRKNKFLSLRLNNSRLTSKHPMSFCIRTLILRKRVIMWDCTILLEGIKYARVLFNSVAERQSGQSLSEAGIAEYLSSFALSRRIFKHANSRVFFSRAFSLSCPSRS